MAYICRGGLLVSSCRERWLLRAAFFVCLFESVAFAKPIPCFESAFLHGISPPWRRSDTAQQCAGRSPRLAVSRLRLSEQSSDEWKADMQQLRGRIEKMKRFDGPSPSPQYCPQDVIAMTLEALQKNDEPTVDAGSSLLLRFASDKFKMQLRWLIGTATSPAALSSIFRRQNNQFHLLLCDYDFTFPIDTYFADDSTAFQEVRLEARPSPRSAAAAAAAPRSPNAAAAENDAGAVLLATLGWELVRDGAGCWRTDSVYWHDFRDQFRPGIGQEEWPRICG